jgi:hypothetical protein
MHAYHLRFIPKGVGEDIFEVRTFLHDVFQIDLAMRNAADVIGGKPLSFLWEPLIKKKRMNNILR